MPSAVFASRRRPPRGRRPKRGWRRRRRSRAGGARPSTASGAAVFGADDLTQNGRTVIGAEAYVLVQALGEPNEVQMLPAGGGRILLYDGAAVRLGLDEATGAEVVLGVTATGDIPGPRGLQVGMTAQAAAGLFRCDADVYASGGALYIEGEAYGEPPFAEMSAESDGEATIRYLCRMDNGECRALTWHSRRGRRLLAFVHGRGGGGR